MLRMFIASLSLGAVVAVTAGSLQAADAKCTIAVDGDNPVVKACKAGGIKEAKTTMKSMVKDAKAKGKKMDCDGCHKNEEDWKLTDDGKKKFDELLALVKK
jgi:hypothetical protein